MIRPLLTSQVMPRKYTLILLILLFAFALRTARLGSIPPGLTHDEANHGREALGVLDGVLLFYFPLNYGSEPLYSYTVAGSMLAFGQHMLALRLVNVFFGLGAIALTYRWAAQALGRRTALLAVALMAVSFWPVASSREALRAGMLPFFMAAAVWFFWRILHDRILYGQGSETAGPGETSVQPALAIAFGVSVAVTLHIYLAARVAWLVFPLFVGYLALFHRRRFKRAWGPTLVGLGLAAVLVTPLFVYLRYHPEALTRLDMLDRPLQELQSGNLRPLLNNAAAALLAFVWPGYGDAFLAYNIPGRPVFDIISAVFFVTGLLVCLWRWRRPPFAFLLLWFGVGIVPSLVTGPTANTTRNLAAISAVFLLPPVGFTAAVEWLQARARQPISGKVWGTAAVAWLAFAGWFSARDYFLRWAESPEVRGAYQRTLIEALRRLQQDAADLPIVISTVYPGPAHDPSIARVMLPQSHFEMRWVDARYALALPAGRDVRVVVPASTPANPAFAELLRPEETVTLRSDDLDPSFTLYTLEARPFTRWAADETWAAVNFNDALDLVAARWLKPEVRPGETADLLTIWRVTHPDRVGPIVPPAFTTDVVMFTHVLDERGGILTQRDSLEAPSWDWQAGDLIAQVHPVMVPPETAPGEYQTAVGVYDRASGARLPIIGPDGPGETRAFVPPLAVVAP